MKILNKIFGTIALVGILLLITISFILAATYSSSNAQIVSPGASSFDFLNKQGITGIGGFDQSKCKPGQDFLVQIAPFGCTPAVVRSDLLEEQNVPIFCKLSATQVNPLIKVEAIDFISFKGDYPKEVSGVGFHPARAALKNSRTTLLNSPVLENIGYAVIVLRQQPNESSMPEVVRGNLTASIRYDIENAFGIGQATHYLPYLNDDEWGDKYKQYGFWNGKGYLRAENIESRSAVISVYSDANHKVATFPLNQGQLSNNVYLPGFYCQAGMRVRLDSVEAPDTRVKLNINGDIVEVPQGGKFLNNACTVRSISKQGINEKAHMQCVTDEGSKRFDLRITPKVTIEIKEGNKVETKEVTVGDRLYNSPDNTKAVYLAYAGTGKYHKVSGLITETDSGENQDLFAVLLAKDQISDRLSESELDSISNIMKRYKAAGTSSGFANFFINFYKSYAGGVEFGFRKFFEGQNFALITFDEETSFYGGGFKGWFSDVKIILKGSSAPQNNEKVFANNPELKEYYENAMKDYREIINKYSNEKETDNSQQTFGEQALINSIVLANNLGQQKNVSELCDDFKQRYPDSPRLCSEELKRSSIDLSSNSVSINGNLKTISIEGIYEPSVEEYSAKIAVRDPSGKVNQYKLVKNQLVYLDEVPEGAVKRVLDLTLKEKCSIYGTAGFDYELCLDGQMTVPEPPSVDSLRDCDITGLAARQIPGIDCKCPNGFVADERTRICKPYSGKSASYIQLVSLEEGYAVLNVNLQGNSYSRARIDLDASNAFRSQYLVSLEEINLKKQARVSVVPNVQNAGTQANFSFAIGIEKRAIQLSPEKINEKIENLNSSINKWEEKSENLGEVVKGFNGMCLATGTYLTAKNFVSNLDGKSIARQEVMRSDNGWMDICAEEIKTTKESMDACLLKHSAEIDKDVEVVHKVIQEQNKKENKITEENIGQKLESVKSGLVDQGDDISEALTPQGYKDGKVSLTQARDLERIQKALQTSGISPQLKTALEKERELILNDISANAQFYSDRNTLVNTLGISPDQIQFMEVGKDVKRLHYTGLTYSNVKNNLVKISDSTGAEYNDNAPISILQTSEGKKYIIFLDSSTGTDRLNIKYSAGSQLIYDTNGRLIPSNELSNEVKRVYFQKFDSVSCKNAFVKPEVKYFEVEPYKGSPSIVPFDTKNGWYTSMSNAIPGFGKIRAYDDSGRVASFYLCNVGKNGKAEPKSGDDVCTAFNPGTGQIYGEHPCLTPTETSRKVSDAMKAVNDASRQYKAGLRGKIRILDEYINVGSPAVDVPEFACQDFMSPKECGMLFNACDPVVCPSSRCNLGGNYYVSDVIQSGIIGSTIMCLPNYKEVVVPVCLTGIKAGLDNYVSVQKNYRDCLQENLATGRTVGICDQIHSIYMCELFWSNAQPFAQVAIPKLFEFIKGEKGTRGGGEYLGVQSAWQNAQDSYNYIANYYGANVFNAFKTKATESVGSVFCKTFVSMQYPSEIGIDAILEPESPPQFTAWFSENSFTTATIPPMSQYKVFYHIFAGKNEGAYYSVYLKAPVGTSFYQTPSVYTVASGYITAGDYASETKDFTTSTGYKELCVRVNAQEECGFQKVTTNFALNYGTDVYLKEQAGKTNIKSEAECVSGSPSFSALANINLQTGVEKAINPEIYNQNIIRICSTENPAKRSDPLAGTPQGRWQEVGTCDGNAGKVKCYLDTKSVKDAIKVTSIEDETLSKVKDNVLNQILKEGEYIQDFQALLDQIDNLKTPQEKISFISSSGGLIDKVLYNSQKAKLLFIRGIAYDEIVVNLFSGIRPTTQDKKDTVEHTDENVKLPKKVPEGIEEGILQFYKNMRYKYNVISWEITSSKCSSNQGKDILYVFNRLSAETDGVVTFEQKTWTPFSKADISVNCEQRPQNGEEFDLGDLKLYGLAELGEIKLVNGYAIIESSSVNVYIPSATFTYGKCPENVALHEILHALGFRHTNNPESVLYPQAIKCKEDPIIDSEIIEEIKRLYSQKDIAETTETCDVTSNPETGTNAKQIHDNGNRIWTLQKDGTYLNTVSRAGVINGAKTILEENKLRVTCVKNRADIGEGDVIDVKSELAQQGAAIEGVGIKSVNLGIKNIFGQQSLILQTTSANCEKIYYKIIEDNWILNREVVAGFYTPDANGNGFAEIEISLDENNYYYFKNGEEYFALAYCNNPDEGEKKSRENVKLNDLSKPGAIAVPSVTLELKSNRDSARLRNAVQTGITSGVLARECDRYSTVVLNVVSGTATASVPDPLLVMSVMMQESSCNAEAVGSGASSNPSYGLMQITEGTFNTHCKDVSGIARDFDSIKGSGNTRNNIACGAKILKDKYNEFKAGKEYTCHSSGKVKYFEWAAALRGYNGWNTLCVNNQGEVVGEPNYVEEVIEKYESLI